MQLHALGVPLHALIPVVQAVHEVPQALLVFGHWQVLFVHWKLPVQPWQVTCLLHLLVMVPHFPVHAELSEHPHTLAVPPPPQVSGEVQLFGQVPPHPLSPPHLPVQLGVQHDRALVQT